MAEEDLEGSLRRANGSTMAGRLRRVARKEGDGNGSTMAEEDIEGSLGRRATMGMEVGMDNGRGRLRRVARKEGDGNGSTMAEEDLEGSLGRRAMGMEVQWQRNT